MKFSAIVLSIGLVAACRPITPELTPGFEAFAILPTQWSEKDASFAMNAHMSVPCRAYSKGRTTLGKKYSRDDFITLAGYLHTRGLSRRDIELLASRDQSFGTGQSFLGLSCSVGYEPEVNKSFYQGVGHRWQAILPGPRYIYLEGDGTPTGMTVTGWN